MLSSTIFSHSAITRLLGAALLLVLLCLAVKWAVALP